MPPVVESYAELAAAILRRPPRLGRTRLVAVDGPSGAGKTLFAGRLAAALAVAPDAVPAAPAGGARPEPRIPVVRTDDLLDGWADQFTFWDRLDEWILAPVRAGLPGRYRRYDWTSGRFGDDWIGVPPAPALIVEGVSSARSAVAAELTLGVFVTAPAPLCRARTLARDGAALLPRMAVWRRRERVHFAADRTAERADLVVDGAAAPDPHGTAFVRIR